MSLLSIFIVLVVVGVGLYLINRYLPMEQVIKTIINVLVILFVLVWLLKMFVPGIDSL